MTAPSREGGTIQDVRNGFELPNNGGSGGRYSKQHGNGDFVERADGQILVCYTTKPTDENRKVMLSVVDSFDTLLGVSNSAVTNEWEFLTLSNTITSGALQYCNFLKIPRSDPEDLDEPDPILMFVYDLEVSGTITVKVYHSLNGLGTDFAFLSTIHTATNTAGTTGARGLSMPVRLDSGRIVIGFGIDFPSTYNKTKPHFGYSDNRGASWTVTAPAGSTALVASWFTIKGISVSGNQLAVMLTYNVGSTYTRYIISEDGGATWTDITGDDALPARSNTDGYFRESYVSAGRSCSTHESTDYNYLIFHYEYFKVAIYRRPKSSPIPHAEPSLDGWEGPLNADINPDDSTWYIGEIEDERGQDDPIHIIGNTSHFGGGTIFAINAVKEFKIAIVAIADQVIRSTFPLVRMFLVFAHRLNGSDHLEFKLVSPLETITSYDDGDGFYVANRFAYSYDGGARWINWPVGGVPVVNPWGLLVACNIQVPPGRSVSLTPYCRIFAGAGTDRWWENLFEKRVPDWIGLGLSDGDKGDAWEPSFEHEVTGLP